jgi:iron complex outermembrane receptor protein
MESHELQFIGNAFDERLHYTGGLFYYEEETAQDNPQTFSLPIAFIAPVAPTPRHRPAVRRGRLLPARLGGAVCVGSQRLPIPGATIPTSPDSTDFYYGQDTESWAAYGQTTYAVTDQFDLTLGIRYTEDEKDAFLYNQNIAGFTKDDPITADDKWDNISYKINGNYAFTDDVSVYLTYATGYNGGGFNARASNVSFQTPFEEEEVETWELGLKSEWWTTACASTPRSSPTTTPTSRSRSSRRAPAAPRAVS